MTITKILVFTAFATALASGLAIVKREIPVHGGYHSFNAIDFSSFKLPLPPAYSTVVLYLTAIHILGVTAIVVTLIYKNTYKFMHYTLYGTPHRRISDMLKEKISFVQSHHSKPVSYSGFTNHGRGHHDPGYAVEFRSEGFHHPPHHHHYY